MLRAPAARELLDSFLNDRSEGLRLVAVRSMARHDADALEKLRPLLADSSERVRRAASRTLALADRMARPSAASGN